MQRTIIDVHSHIYPPAYLSLLRSRKQVPYLFDPSKDGSVPPRLIILPSDDDPSMPAGHRGRPIDAAYSSTDEIIQFMNTHNLRISVLSLANPWLDFLPASEGPEWAQRINTELDEICARSKGRLLAFGALPLSASGQDICDSIRTLSKLRHLRGIIMGTSGLGQGLDDPDLDAVYDALQDTQTLVFLHPHYGLPSSVFGPRASESGHVLPLSLGFPLETTIAFTRMFLSGVFDRFPQLQILIAHAGATVPFLSGRIMSCVEHERHYCDDTGNRNGGPQRSLPEVMASNVWLDAVVYSSTAVKAAAEVVGKKRVMFGSDHPFFPPLQPGAQVWKSVQTNIEAIQAAFPDDEEAVTDVLGGNAARLFNIPIE